MIRLSRRQVLATAGTTLIASPFILRNGARAAEFNYKYANNLTVTHPMNIRALEAADKIRKETNGRFELQVFPSSQLGSDTDTLGQLRSGAVEFFTMSGLILSTLVPTAAINGVGFAFPDSDTVWKAMDGELGVFIRQQIGKANIVAMDKIWDNGFRQITSSTRPIVTPDDLKNFKIRVPVSPLWTSMFSAFQSAPVSINFNEVYSSLQTKVVEGQENPIALVSTSKLYEVQKYCSLTNHMWDGFWFLANRRAWEALPANIREIVAHYINEAGLNERADVAKLNSSVEKELVANGMVFNTTDPAAFRQVLRNAGFYSDWKKKFGEEPWALLEKFVGNLA